MLFSLLLSIWFPILLLWEKSSGAKALFIDELKAFRCVRN